jgi:hypothetical protein
MNQWGDILKKISFSLLRVLQARLIRLKLGSFERSLERGTEVFRKIRTSHILRKPFKDSEILHHLVHMLAIRKRMHNAEMKFIAPLSTVNQCLHFELNKLVLPPSTCIGRLSIIVYILFNNTCYT